MTEKQYAPTKNEKKVSQQKVAKPKIENKTPISKESKATEIKQTETKPEIKKEIKKPIKKIKKEEVFVNARSLPISTKYAMALCKFIKNKPIEKAIEDLNQVLLMKKAVPMKGEIPHRKGEIMSGRFPKKATENFIMILKSLLGNANNHDVEEPKITFAMANIASRQVGRFGRTKKKRTHVTLKARSIKKNSSKSNQIKLKKQNKK